MFLVLLRSFASLSLSSQFRCPTPRQHERGRNLRHAPCLLYVVPFRPLLLHPAVVPLRSPRGLASATVTATATGAFVPSPASSFGALSISPALSSRADELSGRSCGGGGNRSSFFLNQSGVERNFNATQSLVRLRVSHLLPLLLLLRRGRHKDSLLSFKRLSSFVRAFLTCTVVDVTCLLIILPCRLLPFTYLGYKFKSWYTGGKIRKCRMQDFYIFLKKVLFLTASSRSNEGTFPRRRRRRREEPILP